MSDFTEAVVDPLESSLIWLLGHFGRPMSRAALRAQVARKQGQWRIEQMVEALESFGVRTLGHKPGALADTPLDGPRLLVSAKGEILLVTGERERSGELRVLTDGITPDTMAEDALLAWRDAMALTFTPPLRAPAENAAYARGRFGHWFWGPILSARSIYVQVALAALLTNVFALSASIFSMIVYDRVMPNGAMETLIALLIGVGIVFASDFIIRTLRSYFLDLAGARADMIIADTLFEQIIDVRLGARKGSVGASASVLREFESLRDFLTSATLTVLIDIPFALIFVIVIGMIGGPLVWVPVLVSPLVILASLAVQPSLRRLVKISQEDGRNKNAILVETLAGIETLKAIGAGSIMRRRWQEAVSHQAAIGLKTRMFGQFAGNVANLAGQLVWVGVVTLGFFLVQHGQIGTGAIVACSMLAGRVVSPLAQLAQLLTRVNQSLASYHALQELMALPREHAPRASFVDYGALKGGIEFRNVWFNYPGQSKGGLEDVSFTIEPGEKVAFVGPVGSGKSTITKLILGLYQPDRGVILIDGIDSRQFDPADIRRAIGAVMQDVWLMSGTVKDNIAIGGENPTDADILEAARIACVHEFISTHPDGYGMQLKERGEGLSGGQRQALSIARALVGRPPIVILDEATSAFDVATERVLLNRLNAALTSRTLIVVTHRASLFELVQKVVVMQEGRIVASGPKDELLRRLAQAGGQG
ncbi:MAG: type secretion system ATPase [Hyphomicrobiales bacterium]|nr:type secretion system ATPase [Hyphomicrobiales bacterium]